MDEHRPLRTFGRTKARTLKPRQAALVETLLPYLAVDVSAEIDVEALFSFSRPAAKRPANPTEAGWLCDPEAEEGAGAEGRSPARAFEQLSTSYPPAISAPWDRKTIPQPYDSAPVERPVGRDGIVLEIGFGGGEHLVAQAGTHPNLCFIGVEPFLNGVASCLRHIEASGVTNVRLHQGDARDVIARLPDASLKLCYILFPDPWPKTRHHKRRLIQPAFLSELARVLEPGAEVRFATDWANYAAWTLEHFAHDARFMWNAECAGDWRHAWPGHVRTRYEQKRLGDCVPIWLRFVRA